MNFFNNLSFRIKLIIPISAIALLFFIMGVSSITMLTSIGHKTTNIAKDYLAVQQRLLKADTDLHQAMLANKGLILQTSLDSDNAKALMKDFLKNIKQAQDRVPSYQQLTDKGLALDMTSVMNQYSRLSQQWSNAVSSNQLAGNDQTFEDMRDLIDQLLESTFELSDNAVLDTEKTIQTNQTLAITLLMSGLGVCLFVILFFPKLITQRLQKLLQQIRNIAKGNGDLTKRLSMDSKDEIGEMAIAIDDFVSKIQSLILNVISIADQLEKSQQCMSQNATDANNAINQQKREVELVSQAIADMAHSATDIAKNAEQALENATQSDQAAQQGLNVVATTQGAIAQLSTKMNQANDVIHSLQGNSIEIGSVVDVINGIAEQTNLLALNAAIEAARAGEQGRGFAVVADEVRTLAARTQQSTTEIQSMILKLQNISNDAVAVISESEAQTQEAVTHVTDTGNSLQTIAETTSIINDINSSVASASDEQTRVSDALNDSMNNINQQIHTTAQSTQQTNENCLAVEEMAINLQKELANFKVK